MTPPVALLTLADLWAMAPARKAGGIIVRRRTRSRTGRCAGTFRDADGHLWEIAWDPALELD